MPTYKYNGQIYDVPEEEKDEFTKKLPNATEVQSFVLKKDTFDVPIVEVERFKEKVPEAKLYDPLKKKEEVALDWSGMDLPGLPDPSYIASQDATKRDEMFESEESLSRKDKEKSEAYGTLVGKFKEDIGNRLEGLSSEREALESQIPSGEAVKTGWGGIVKFPEGQKESAQAINENTKKKERLEKSMEMLNDIEGFMENREKGFGKGFVSKMENIYTLGLNELSKTADVAKIALKYNDDPSKVSEEEMGYLKVYGLMNAAKADLRTSQAYDVGSAVAESLPFMAQFAVGTPFAKMAIEGTKGATKKIANKYVRGAVEELIGATAKTVTGLTPTLATDYAQRRGGDIITDKEGDVTVEGQQGVLESGYKAFAGTLATSLVESGGGRALKQMKPVGDWMAKKVGAQKFLDDIPNMPKYVKQARDFTGYNGIIAEIAEELVEPAAQALVTMEKAPLAAYDSENLLTMVYSTLIIGQAHNVVAAPGYVRQKRTENAIRRKEAEKELTGKRINDVDAIIDKSKDAGELGKEMRAYVNKMKDEGVDKDGVAKVLAYSVERLGGNIMDEASAELSKATEKEATQKPKEDEAKPKETAEAGRTEKPVEETGKPKEEMTEKVQFGDEMPAKKGMSRILRSDPEKTFTTPIVKGKEVIGDITVEKQDKTWDVKWVEINKSERGKGHGKDIYRNANELAQKEGKVIQSDVVDKSNPDTAGKVWESLVKSGEAVKTEDGRYQMLPLKEGKAESKSVKTEEKVSDFTKMETDLNEINSSIDQLREENPGQFKKDGTPKAKSKILPVYKALVDNKSSIAEQMQGLQEAEFVKRGREESEKSRIEAEKINEAFEERQKELEKNIPETELQEQKESDEVDRIFDKVTNEETPTQQEIDFVNEKAFLPKGFQFGKKGLEKVKKAAQPSVEAGTKPPAEKGAVSATETKDKQPKKETPKDRKEKKEELKKAIKEDSDKQMSKSGFFGSEPVRKGKEDVHSNFKRLFLKEGGLPGNTFEANRRKKGAVSAKLYKANVVVYDAHKAAKKAFGVKKVTKEQADLIMDVLENMGTRPKGRAEELSRLPETLRPHIEKMRDMLDGLSKEIQQSGILSEENMVVFDANTGFYLTRAYRKHLDPKYTWERIPDDVKEKAGEALMEYYPDASKEKIMGILKNIVDDKSFSSFVMEKPLGKMDMGITKRKSEFLTDNPAIRELMGEIRNPFTTFAVSTAKMSELAERAKFLNNVTEMGLKEGWLKEDIEGEYRKPIGADKILGFNFNGPRQQKGSKSLSPLNEYYTTPEIARAFEQFNDATRITNTAVRIWMRGVTETKLAHTAFSVGSQARNAQSNLINLLANGAWNVHQTVPEISSRLKDRQARRGFIAELKEMQIIEDNVESGAIIRNIESLSGHVDKLYTPESKGKKAVVNSRKFFLDMYQMGDDVFKAYRYVSEYTRYNEVYMKQGMDKAKAMDKAKETAMEILHDTQTYYSNVPKFIDALRVLPMSGTFITFPYLTMGALYNTAKLSVKEMKDPATFGIGLQRGAGMMAAVSGLSIMAMMVNRGNGMDDDDMVDIRRAMPDYWKNDILTVKEDKGDGVFLYSNTSYLDFYNAVTTPVLSLVHAYTEKGNVDVGDFVHAAGIFFSPYTDTDILFQRTVNVLSNWDNETKRPVYNESLPERDRMLAIAEYLAGSMVPATLKDISRSIEMHKRGADGKSFLLGRMTGRQTRELDLARSFALYKVPIAKQKIQDAAGIYNKIKTNDAVSEKEKMEHLETANRQVNHYITELHKDFTAFKRQRASEDKMLLALDQNYGGYKMTKTVRDAIIDGTEVIIDKKGDVVSKSQYEVLSGIVKDNKGKDYIENEGDIRQDLYEKMFGDRVYKELTQDEKTDLTNASKKLKSMFMDEEAPLFEKEINRLLYGSNDNKVKMVAEYEKEHGTEKAKELVDYMKDWDMLSRDLYWKLHDRFGFMREDENQNK